jgi:hypothetical protein
LAAAKAVLGLKASFVLPEPIAGDVRRPSYVLQAKREPSDLIHVTEGIPFVRH